MSTTGAGNRWPRRLWRGLFWLAGVLAALALCFEGSAALGQGTVHAMEKKVIRVGFPEQEGLSEVDEYGKFSGYTYDYLQEIAQYTGWEYEFVQLPGHINDVLSTMLQMLQDGELDLMGAMVYNDQLAQMYSYPSSSYGTAYTTLRVLTENSKINEMNYQNIPNLRIGVYASSKVGLEELVGFTMRNGLEYVTVPYSDDENLLDALKSGEVDTILSRSVSPLDGTRAIARFEPKPFYFATTHGNYEIVNAIDNALLMISDADPSFANTLYQKYFDGDSGSLRLNDSERSYLTRCPVLRVAVAPNSAPFETYSGEEGGYYGISFDILEYISENTGLQFQYVAADSTEHIMEMLRDGQADLAASIPYHYESAQKYQFSLTRPYTSTEVIMAARKGIDPYFLPNQRLAVPRGFVLPEKTSGTVLWMDTVQDCLEAVNSGDADYCYGNGYAVQYYCNQKRYGNLVLTPQSNQVYRFCIGISHSVDNSLLTIFNKTLRGLPEGELQAIVYQNTIPDQENVTLLTLVESNPQQAVLYVSLIMLLVVGVLVFILYMQRRARQQTEMENKRYQLLADLSGEFLFEYNYPEDTLTLTEQTANMFQIPQVTEKFHAGLMAKRAGGKDPDWILQLHEQLQKQENVTLESQVSYAGGEPRWLRVTAAVARDLKNRPVCAIGKIQDVQREREEKEELSRKAQCDSLTGLYNPVTTRRLIEDYLEDAGSQAGGTLMILDIDYFKKINDQNGHYTGDEVLKKTASVLRSIFRENDIIGRLGGDEFIIFMKGGKQAQIAAEKCKDLQRKMKDLSVSLGFSITLSMGAAIVEGEIEYDRLYHDTDDALYLVKKRGRDGFAIVNADKAEKADREA